MLGMLEDLRKMNVREVLHQGINLGTKQQQHPAFHTITLQH